jgi:hypothetical protein
MRVFRVSFSLWYDPRWWAHRRHSWRHRRYWLARPVAPTVDGRALALQFGPVTLKWTAQGVNHG